MCTVTRPRIEDRLMNISFLPPYLRRKSTPTHTGPVHDTGSCCQINQWLINLPRGEHLRKEAAPKWGKVCRKHAGELSLKSISRENTPVQFNPILSNVQMKLYTVILFRQAHYIRVDDVRRNQACRLVSQSGRSILFLERGPLRVAGKSMPH